jgi:hypothetical protein
MCCPICLEQIKTENTYKTQCNHSFHNECINHWFRNNKNTCPMCRKVIYIKNKRSFDWERVTFETDGENNLIIDNIPNDRNWGLLNNTTITLNNDFLRHFVVEE